MRRWMGMLSLNAMTTDGQVIPSICNRFGQRPYLIKNSTVNCLGYVLLFYFKF